MMSYYLKLKNQFGWSVLLHLVLGFVVFFSWQFTKQTGINKKSNNFIQAYTYHIASHKSEPIEHIVKKSNVGWTKEHRDVSTIRNSKSNLKTTSDANNNKTDPLLNILHNAIAENQHYPDNAAALGQTGTVKIGFTLYPDGHLSNATIIKSSGINDLDNAALTAVQTLTPIKDVSKYLSAAQFFALDVVFAES